jgi:hypothetical protein
MRQLRDLVHCWRRLRVGMCPIPETSTLYLSREQAGWKLALLEGTDYSTKAPSKVTP